MRLKDWIQEMGDAMEAKRDYRKITPDGWILLKDGDSIPDGAVVSFRGDETYYRVEKLPIKADGEDSVGVKYDQGKTLASLLGDFSRALMGVADVGTFGANKYSRGGWLLVKDNKQRYTDALWRHLLQSNVEENDAESGMSHLEHAAWNILAVIELIKREKAK